MNWKANQMGADKWCPENDGAYRAEQAAIHGQRTEAAEQYQAFVDRIRYDKAEQPK